MSMAAARTMLCYLVAVLLFHVRSLWPEVNLGNIDNRVPHLPRELGLFGCI